MTSAPQAASRGFLQPEFCTYFDEHFLARGLALHQSLTRHCPQFRLWILCLSDACHQRLERMALPSVMLVSLPALEAADPDLLKAKATRSHVEYYFTLTPAVLLHIFHEAPDIDLLTYLDADLFFFADPVPLLGELGDCAVGIVPHRFAPELQGYERNGIYNVAWNSFRRNPDGLACLEWWRARCLEWCYDRHEPGRYADQKYLDDWPTRFKGVNVLQGKGVDLAPWNVDSCVLSQRDGSVLVDGERLVFYHFHGVRRTGPGRYDTRLRAYKTRLGKVLRDSVYLPYLRIVEAMTREEEASPRPRGNRVPALLRPALQWCQSLHGAWAGDLVRVDPAAEPGDGQR